MGFFDSLSNLVNNLANRRNALNNNQITASRLKDSEARAIYRTGLGSKICRIKSGYALKDTIQFDSTNDETFYKNHLAKSVKRAAKFSVAFGRGIIVILERGGDLKMPVPKSLDINQTRLIVFSGDMVNTGPGNPDLNSDNYMRPEYYTVRGQQIHRTRVVDFTYVEPPEMELPEYRYGGISEFELIRPQLVADEIVQRAVPSILEKSSVIFYKLRGFTDNLMANKADQVSQYISNLEDLRSIHGAGIVDKEDEVVEVNQTLSNLAESDMITLRRLSMVTGIPLALLVGENVKGLNSTGETEQEAFQDMIETLQSEYLLHPINRLMAVFGLSPIEFRANQGQSPEDRVDFDRQVIENAKGLSDLGKDYGQYLEEYDVVKRPDYSNIFEPDDDVDDELPGDMTVGEALDL